MRLNLTEQPHGTANVSKIQRDEVDGAVDPEPLKIIKLGHLCVSRAPPHLIVTINKKFGEITPILS